MKLQLRKDIKETGDIYYQVWMETAEGNFKYINDSSVYGGTLFKPIAHAEKDAEEVLEHIATILQIHKPESTIIKTIEI